DRGQEGRRADRAAGLRRAAGRLRQEPWRQCHHPRSPRRLRLRVRVSDGEYEPPSGAADRNPVPDVFRPASVHLLALRQGNRRSRWRGAPFRLAARGRPPQDPLPGRLERAERCGLKGLLSAFAKRSAPPPKNSVWLRAGVASTLSRRGKTSGTEPRPCILRAPQEAWRLDVLGGSIREQASLKNVAFGPRTEQGGYVHVRRAEGVRRRKS